VMKFICFK